MGEAGGDQLPSRDEAGTAGNVAIVGWGDRLYRLVAVVVGVTVLVAILVDAGTGTTTGEVTEPDTMRVSGSVVLHGEHRMDIVGVPGPGAPCEGAGLYRDIVAGAPVTVTAPDGAVLGTGHLGSGRMARSAEDLVCNVPFVVHDVSTGYGSYGVEVADRGVVTFREDHIASSLRRVELNIGR